MRIVAKYSFNNGEKFVQSEYAYLLREVEHTIRSVDCMKCKTENSTEKTRPKKSLYNSIALNAIFKTCFYGSGWISCKEKCEYSDAFYIDGYKPIRTEEGFRNMDFVKERLGIEIQFGEYVYMIYSGCAKMTIFRNLGVIDAGIEIVPVKRFADEMSTGVSYFEQFAWDLEQRGVSNIDVPVLILGIDA